MCKTQNIKFKEKREGVVKAGTKALKIVWSECMGSNFNLPMFKTFTVFSTNIYKIIRFIVSFNVTLLWQKVLHVIV